MAQYIMVTRSTRPDLIEAVYYLARSLKYLCIMCQEKHRLSAIHLDLDHFCWSWDSFSPLVLWPWPFDTAIAPAESYYDPTWLVPSGFCSRSLALASWYIEIERKRSRLALHLHSDVYHTRQYHSSCRFVLRVCLDPRCNCLRNCHHSLDKKANYHVYVHSHGRNLLTTLCVAHEFSALVRLSNASAPRQTAMLLIFSSSASTCSFSSLISVFTFSSIRPTCCFSSMFSAFTATISFRKSLIFSLFSIKSKKAVILIHPAQSFSSGNSCRHIRAKHLPQLNVSQVSQKRIASKSFLLLQSPQNSSPQPLQTAQSTS